jgi:hypothetical protein
MTKTRVNIMLDEEIHKDSVKLAKSYGYDFSSFVNLMLDTLLNPVNVEDIQPLMREMIIRELNNRGFFVPSDALQIKGAQGHHEQAGKRRQLAEVKKGKK